MLPNNYKTVKPNYEGVPPENLTWKEVFNMNLPYSTGRDPKKCPACNSDMKKYKSAYEKIENSGQYMVQGVYCPEGHFTYLECA